MRNQSKDEKIKKFTSKMQASLLLVFCVVIVAFVVLIGRLIFLNNKDGDKYAKRVLSQQTYVSNVIPYKRGDIVDRKGTVLARSEKVYNLVLDPKLILEKVKDDQIYKQIYKDPTIEALVNCFGADKEEINEILTKKKDKRYYVLEKELSYKKVDSFNAYVKKLKEDEDGVGNNIKGIWFEEEYVRKYPLDTVASDIIGFTSKGNVGNWGIEEYYNAELNGSNGREYGYFDGELNLERTVKPAQNGNTIISTIDANVQEIIEEEIKKYNKDIGSKNTAVMVMNPQNGEILAMASYPSYDLNNPRDLEPFYSKSEIAAMNSEETLTALNEIWRNYSISDTYEPGSTFKPFTMAASFEEAKLNGNETYFCDGYEEVLGSKIRCSKRTGHGNITLEEAMMYSCNDALMQIAKKTGKNTFSIYQDNFGFGGKTGIDLPGEADGLVFTKDQLNPIELATSSFGQGPTVTMVQMVSAFSSVINGGAYYQPHVVKQIQNDKGATVRNIEETLVKETVSKKTSDTLKEYMYQTVEEGTAKGAQVPGYAIGGKTGTAEKIPRGNGNYLVSFLGFAPAENPTMVIYVIVDEPNVEIQADSSIATKMASRIMKQILPFLNIYPIQEAGDDKTTEDNKKNITTEEITQDDNKKNNESIEESTVENSVNNDENSTQDTSNEETTQD